MGRNITFKMIKTKLKRKMFTAARDMRHAMFRGRRGQTTASFSPETRQRAAVMFQWHSPCLASMKPWA